MYLGESRKSYIALLQFHATEKCMCMGQNQGKDMEGKGGEIEEMRVKCQGERGQAQRRMRSKVFCIW